MKAGSKLLLFFMVSLLCINFITPFTSIQTPSLGIQIEHPISDTIKIGEQHKFHFHIFNATDGKQILANATTTCSFHLYDPKGNHLVKMNYNVGSDDILDYEALITGGNFSYAGQYSYVFQCNQSTIGGFYGRDFQVSPTGFVGTLGFYILIFGLSLLAIIVGYSFEDEWVIIFGSFGLILTGLFVLINGIVGIKDAVYTYSFGIIITMLGSYFAIRAALSKVDSGFNFDS